MNPSQPPQRQTPSTGNQAQPSPYQSTPHDPANPYPQQPQQQQQGFPMGPRTDGFAITSMVLGIIAVVSCYFGAIPGLIAVIFGHLSLGKIKKDPQTIGGKGMAIAGLVTGYIGIAVTIFCVVALALAVNSDDGPFSVFGEEFQESFEAEMKKQQEELEESARGSEELVPDQE